MEDINFVAVHQRPSVTVGGLWLDTVGGVWCRVSPADSRTVRRVDDAMDVRGGAACSI